VNFCPKIPKLGGKRNFLGSQSTNSPLRDFVRRRSRIPSSSTQLMSRLKIATRAPRLIQSCNEYPNLVRGSICPRSVLQVFIETHNQEGKKAAANVQIPASARDSAVFVGRKYIARAINDAADPSTDRSSVTDALASI